MKQHPTNAFQLEVCVDRVEDAVVAAKAGATRIEMNCALECSGLTPSVASCRWLVENCPVPVVAMVRPHDASFHYTQVEQKIMLRDCAALLETGVQGIVSGGLDEHGRIDVPLVKRLVAEVSAREFIFHRAFDRLADMQAGLELLIDCGVTRVLTSGGASTAIDGKHRLRDLVAAAGERIEILPGGGVSSSNAVQLIEQVACRQLHGSFRTSDAPSHGTSGPDPRQVAAVCDLMRRYSTTQMD